MRNSFSIVPCRKAPALRGWNCSHLKYISIMKISEFVNECQELLANKQWSASSFEGRSIPENTQPELGHGQNHVWQQGVPVTLGNADIVGEVLGWTNWNPHVISTRELCDAYMGRYEDREVEMEWNARTA